MGCEGWERGGCGRSVGREESVRALRGRWGSVEERIVRGLRLVRYCGRGSLCVDGVVWVSGWCVEGGEEKRRGEGGWWVEGMVRCAFWRWVYVVE